MNNQLTKLENGIIIKKENVTEQQLINRLYKYERLGTVDKIKSIIESLEYTDAIWTSQFDLARADVEYWRCEAQSYKERYNALKHEFDASIRFREINAGLKRECQKYKELLKSQQIRDNDLCQKIKDEATHQLNIFGDWDLVIPEYKLDKIFNQEEECDNKDNFREKA